MGLRVLAVVAPDDKVTFENLYRKNRKSDSIK
jgi:hypothetical protein